MVDEVPIDGTVEELLESLVPQMNLPPNDREGRPVTYHLLNESEGRHLNATEKIGDSIKPLDRVVYQPNIDAGCA
jgi:hypothetical protein